jgi:diaminohydroxyphosphoribosylaminopyrimidine deaminase/5-amino-6-(5-phosphoribosylamino)uracil reductase
MDPDDLYMKIAIDLAAKGRGRVEPNPMVGALVVHDGEIVGKGFHKAFGGPHAEVAALEDAAGRTRGADLYVTLEPCCHVGKTPPCTKAIIAAGIVRVVSAMTDPDERCSGRGHSELEEAGIKVRTGVLEEEAKAQNAPYIKCRERGVPYVIAKWAMTLDGKISPKRGRSATISCRRSRELVHRVRGMVDAILVGMETVLADNPRLTCRVEDGRSPLRVVLDSQCRTPPESHVASEEAPTLLAVTEHAPREREKALTSRGVEVLRCKEKDGRVDIAHLLTHLGSRGVTNLLVEGGGEVLASFFAAKEVDRVMVFVAPKIMGNRLAPSAVAGPGPLTPGGLPLSGVTIKTVGDDVLIEGRPVYDEAAPTPETLDSNPKSR